MKPSASISYEGLAELQRDLNRAPKALEDGVERVLEKGALNVKNRMVEDAQTLKGHARQFHRSISYDRETRLLQLGYEVGPDKDRPQGALGNLLYFGSKNNAPQLDIEAGLNDEEPRLIKALGDVLGKALE